MLYIKEEICYSPHPPEKYVGPHGFGLGNSVTYKNDLQLWNLIWMSEPLLDKYLVGEVVEMLPGFSATYIGRVGACLYMNEGPHIRELLRQPPKDFFQGLLKMGFTNLPGYIYYKEEWIEKMRSRLADVTIAIAQQGARATVQNVGNVAYLKFGGG